MPAPSWGSGKVSVPPSVPGILAVGSLLSRSPAMLQWPGWDGLTPRLSLSLQSLLVYMLFLLVTLLANYGDASCHSHAYRLQSAIRQELDSRAFLAITR